MATAPLILSRDQATYVANTTYTTNEKSITVAGKVDVFTVDIQVSVNGAPYVSDPTLIAVDQQAFKFPNPASYPSGFVLQPGVNTLLFRTIDLVGAVSGPATVSITQVRDVLVDAENIPSGIRLRRRRDAIDLLVAKPVQRFSANGLPLDPTFRGFNVYASANPAGETTGYFRVNNNLLSLSDSYFEEDSAQVFSDTTTWQNTNLASIRIQVTEEDAFGATLATRLNRLYDVGAYLDKLRFSSTVDSLSLIDFVRFRHYRTGGENIINEDQFADVLDTDPLYYVVTGVYFDPSTNTVFESPYSQEVLGSPLVIDTAILDLPEVRAVDIQTRFINAVNRVNAELSLNPGSTMRDVTIDPFSSEAQRLWFLLDFVHRSQSFLTLLQIDDPNGDGFSDPVASTAYKVALKAALGLTSDQATQNLINTAFDKLAANVSKTRLPGRPSVGQVVFYTTSKPTKDLTVPAGTVVTSEASTALGLSSQRFRVGGSFVLSASNAEAYYNFDTKRYELTVDIVAETIGSAGNVPGGQIKSASGVSGLQVINTEATVFGTDVESNVSLAERAILATTSVDTGTEGGYLSNAIAQVGVLKTKIVKSGDSLMMRDYDDLRKKHIGGKVDIWIQGLRERQVSERFAFTYEVARDILCVIVDLPTLTFRVQDSRVTPDTPILEILNNLPQGLGVRNATVGADYDLTGVAILDYQTFRVSTAIPQPPTFVDDIILADYRFRSSPDFTFRYQPVRRVVSVVGEVSGALNTSTGYKLYKAEDPLMEGESTIANNFLRIIQQGGVPSGDSIQINAELHVMIGFFEEPLDSIGINTKTIRVFSEDRLTEYLGPETPTPDFIIVEGTPTTPAKVLRTSTSAIVSGQTVSVDYSHDENFTVTYVINDLLQQTQQVFDRMRHVTADVVVKQAISNPLDLETTVQLKAGATKDKVDPQLRTRVSQELNQKLIGQGSAQSDIIAVVDNTSGVDFEIVPLARMAYADGARRLRETIPSEFLHLVTLDQGGNEVYLADTALQYPTTDGGGLETEHKGVFQDDVALSLVSDPNTVGLLPTQAAILGASGASLNGYSDDITLQAQGFLTQAARDAERARRTGNRILISLALTVPPDSPGKHLFAVSYVVRGDSGAKDIAASQVEFLELGNLVVTYHKP